MPTAVARLAVLAVLVFACSAARADEVSEKQKKLAAANLKQAEVQLFATVETDDLILAATLPDEKAKALSAQLQKSYLMARKVLQYDDKEKPWTGKLTVYFITESKLFKNFMRTVIGESPRDTEYFINLKGDAPFVLVLGDVSTPLNEPESYGEAAALVATATFNAKHGSGIGIPDWAKLGFGRAVSLRADNPASKRVTSYKTRAKATVVGSSAKPGARMADVWDGGGRDLAISFMDFLAFGPKAMDFPKAVNALKPGENGQAAALPMSLEMALTWKAPDMEAAWKKWVQSGK